MSKTAPAGVERRVIQVTLWNSPYLGNFMSGELAFSRALRDRLGLSTHFVLADRAQDQPWLPELEAVGATWSVLPPERRAWRRHLSRTVEERGGVLIHTHFTAADLQAASVAHALKVPCVWHVRTGFDGYPWRQRVKDLIKMRVIARRGVAHIVAVSPWLGDLTRRRGAPAECVAVIPDAVIGERFATLPDRAFARKHFGLTSDIPVVLAMGWWPEVKGVDILLDAVAILAERGSAPEVLLVGEEALRGFVDRRLPIQPEWLHMSGFLPDAGLLFAAADVFVSASRHEGQSLAIGEALACELEVVMSDIPGTAAWSRAPYVSTFRNEDANALAKHLAELCELPPERHIEQGAANRRWVLLNHGVTEWCERRLAVYESLFATNARAYRPMPEV